MVKHLDSMYIYIHISYVGCLILFDFNHQSKASQPRFLFSSYEGLQLKAVFVSYISVSMSYVGFCLIAVPCQSKASQPSCCALSYVGFSASCSSLPDNLLLLLCSRNALYHVETNLDWHKGVDIFWLWRASLSSTLIVQALFFK